MIKLSEKQKEILKANAPDALPLLETDINRALEIISDAIDADIVENDDEPTSVGLELENIYDIIFYGE